MYLLFVDNVDMWTKRFVDNTITKELLLHELLNIAFEIAFLHNIVEKSYEDNNLINIKVWKI